ncbi:MAG: SCO family protein [Rhodospirillaceae bacterium]
MSMKILGPLVAIVVVLVVGIGARFLPDLTSTTGGEAAIGGPFTLVDASGQTVTEENYEGRYQLFYFGFTYCPDVCPTSLASLATALDLLPEAALEDIAPIFVTIDPERDTPELVGEYVGHFHPAFIGLSGSPDQIAEVAKTFRVYYAKVEDEDGGDYTMDHSSVLYFMDEEGRFLTHFSHGATPEDMASTIKKYLGVS